MQDTVIGMNDFIPARLDDKVFFYAVRIVSREDRSWHITVDPSACLVTMGRMPEGYPTVGELRRGPLVARREGRDTVYEGRLLFSSGVILSVNGKILMLRRDELAPIDPLMWTCPAGRCDRDPLLTGLKEFYEEVILFDTSTGRPVFVSFPWDIGAGRAESVYAASLARKGFHHPPGDWMVVAAEVFTEYARVLREVRTSFAPGGEGRWSAQEFTGEFFVYFDEDNRTLEVRLPAQVRIAPPMDKRLGLCDAESYNRRVKLFGRKEFMAMPEEFLTGTMAELRNTMVRNG